MKIHCIQHASFEGPGFFEKWANINGFPFSITQSHQHEKLPHPNDYDFLLIMGGPQSPNECDKYPYLTDEIKLIKKSILLDKYVLGVCLGAQLVAESYGAKTLKSPHKEIGVFDIMLTDDGKTNPLFNTFSSPCKVGHWHNDMPGLPLGARLMAKSEGCPHQIVRFASKVYGFQCHMEVTKLCIDQLVTNCPQDLLPGKYIQTASQMLQENYDGINAKLKSFLDAWLGLQN